jgi:hypothetical protein
MKKILTISIALALLLFCAVLLYLVYTMVFPQQKIVYDQTNRTFVVKGDVKVKKAAEGASWQKMTTSTVLEKGDRIETSEDSNVDIVIGGDVDKSIKLGSKTNVEIESVNPTSINCSKGKIIVALKKLEPKSSFTVKTPTAICGAQGTAWLEEVDATKTKVCVFESSIYAKEVSAQGKPGFIKHKVDEGTQRILVKGEPISSPAKIPEADTEYWKNWNKNIEYLREGKMLVNDFNKKENFNNLDGPFGSWNVFYSDPNQHCKDEFSATERLGDTGFGLKLDYDVDSPYSAYNGFFTNLMNTDISEYKYLVLSVKGDANIGFTEKINLELKNQRQIGRYTIQGVSGEWKQFVIPLNRFVGITSFKDMKELVIVFSDLNATKKTGVVYIDDIYFTKTEPPAS